MNYLITLLIVCCLTQLLPPINGIPIPRVKRHSGKMDIPNNRQNIAINQLINKWNHWGAVGTGGIRTIYQYGDARLDLQGEEIQNGTRFERYAVQMGDETFAVVHIQVGISFGVGLIREAFSLSRNTHTHVFLSDVEQPGIKQPGDGNNYTHRKITRKWNKELNSIYVWGVIQVVNGLVKRFNKFS